MLFRSANRDYKEAFRQRPRGAERDLYIYTHDWGFRVRDIKMNVNLWYAMQDKHVSPAMGEYYARELPRRRVTVYPTEGHYVSWSHAEEILQSFV